MRDPVETPPPANTSLQFDKAETVVEMGGWVRFSIVASLLAAIARLTERVG